MLVHCVMGVSRSAAVVLGYMMRRGRMTLADALATLRKQRPSVNPHEGFRVQLALFEAAGWEWESWPGWR